MFTFSFGIEVSGRFMDRVKVRIGIIFCFRVSSS
jgi:hypothetical protein